jgi:sortase (surface protein transpeptidase)
MSPPVGISIPAIGVDSPLQALGLQADNSLQSPTEWAEAGWYADGVRPGDPGPAVIAGHVDSRNGPAVFFRLRDLHPGDDVYITTQSGRQLHFVVDTSQRFPKDRFPTEAVYGPTPLPVVRLITCTGAFDAANHNYLDNLVVTAHLA